MKLSRLAEFGFFALLCLSATALRAEVQISVNVGVEPVCPYGYFNYAPYNCAPFGYYGPTWFTGGVFLGSGPWFRGPATFCVMGHVQAKGAPCSCLRRA